MKAKEKAKELYYLFSNTANSYVEGRKCALIAVDEILKLPFEYQSERSYWQEVKQEINKI